MFERVAEGNFTVCENMSGLIIEAVVADDHFKLIVSIHVSNMFLIAKTSTGSPRSTCAL
jgi:hypothetical protein